jgi:hypothetical protein
MTDQEYVYATLAVMVAAFLWQVLTKRFDPFAPVWMFLAGYLQVYVIQAITLREWALNVRGIDLVAAANLRALWALVWFLAVYFSGVGKLVTAILPRPPEAWSDGLAVGLTPPLIGWGLYCALVSASWGTDISAEQQLLSSFPFVMMVAAILLIVTGLNPRAPKPVFLVAGLAVAAAYSMIWMFNGKRSHSMIAVMSTVCAVYVVRRKRPSWAVLFGTAFVASLFVAVAINWRNNYNYDRSVPGFIQYLGDFQFSSILKSLNIENDEDTVDHSKFYSYETVEYGGFLLMMDTVPEKADYDLGANYIRVVSTFIPRIIWADKPLYGRDKWIAAWMAGSEIKRDDDFTGPAIGILGATHLNGGAAGTLIVLGVAAALLRAFYEYFRRYDSAPWAQAWWALSYYNAWYMVAADDPANWFYYNYGFTCMPVMLLLFVFNKLLPAPGAQALPAASA